MDHQIPPASSAVTPSSAAARRQASLVALKLSPFPRSASRLTQSSCWPCLRAEKSGARWLLLPAPAWASALLWPRRAARPGLQVRAAAAGRRSWPPHGPQTLLPSRLAPCPCAVCRPLLKAAPRRQLAAAEPVPSAPPAPPARPPQAEQSLATMERTRRFLNSIPLFFAVCCFLAGAPAVGFLNLYFFVLMLLINKWWAAL